MIVSGKQNSAVPSPWLQVSAIIMGGFLCGALNGQEVASNPPTALPSGQVALGLLAKTSAGQFSEMGDNAENKGDTGPGAALRGASYDSTIRTGGPRRLTLGQAQQQAAASNPMAHLAQLQVEAARQHRLGAESDYFPKISSTLTNFHFNKFMGKEVTVQRPIAGETTTAGVPLAGKDQTLVAVTAAQPITPLFKLREVVNIARADEHVAMAKAGMPFETASNVEKAYYGLLVAQRQLDIARANAGVLRNKQLLASNAAMLPNHEEDDSEASQGAGDRE